MIGLDTETVEGRAWLLCRAGQGVESPVLYVGDEIAWDRVARWLLQEPAHICYNLTYDAQAILLHLDEDIIWRLERLGEADFTRSGKHYRVEWIRSKRLTIKIRDKKGIPNSETALYDCWQFFERKLEDAAQEHLGIGKDTLPEDIDVKNLRPALEDLKRRAIVTKYCLTDARRCLGLWELVEKGLAQVGMVAAQPISGAFLAGKYFLAGRPPNRKSDNPLQEIAGMAYFGGRSELFKRGFYEGPVYCADIHSAYPTEAATLCDPRSLRRHAGREPAGDAELGLYRADLTVRENRAWGPVPVRTSPLTYPVGHFTCWVDLRTLLWLQNLSGVVCKPIECIEWLKTYRRPGKLMFPGIGRLYDLRKDTAKKYAIKKLLNGLYGKLAQVNDRWELVTDPLEATLIERGHMLRGLEEPGPYRDLLLASHITGGCRARLGRAMEGIHASDLLMCATDSVWTCAVPSLDFGPGLGQWDSVEYTAWLGIQTGVYSYRAMDGTWKSMARGFGTKADLKKSLQEAPQSSDKIRIVSRVPLTALWALQNGQPINRIADFPRDLMLNGDEKRFWDRPATAGGLLKGLTSSLPPLYNEPNL